MSSASLFNHKTSPIYNIFIKQDKRDRSINVISSLFVLSVFVLSILIRSVLMGSDRKKTFTAYYILSIIYISTQFLAYLILVISLIALTFKNFSLIPLLCLMGTGLLIMVSSLQLKSIIKANDLKEDEVEFEKEYNKVTFPLAMINTFVCPILLIFIIIGMTLKF